MGAIMVISHDRAFLDSLTNRTLAFESGRVQHYAGNYSFFLRERAARREQLERPQEPTARNRARRKLHRSFPRQGYQSETGAVADQAARKDGAD